MADFDHTQPRDRETAPTAQNAAPRSRTPANARKRAGGPESGPTAPKKRKPKPIEPPLCAHCRLPAFKTTGADVYPNRPDLSDKVIWICRPCEAWCGSHPSGRPLGRPGNKHLRDARMMLHERRFDPIWRAGLSFYAPDADMGPKVLARLCQSRLYRYLAHLLGIEIEECHVAMFDVDMCRRAWTALAGVTYEQARAYVKEEKARHDHRSAN